MKRKLQGKYVPISTVGERAHAFVSAPLPPIMRKVQGIE